MSKEQVTLRMNKQILKKQDFSTSKIELIKYQWTGIIVGQPHLNREFENWKKETKKFRIHTRERKKYEIEVKDMEYIE